MTEAHWRWVGILAAVLGFGLTACARIPETRMNSYELLAAIEAGAAPMILDVRSRAEYDAEHLPGAIHFPFYSTWTRSAEIPGAKDSEVVVYCEHGPRAWLARLGLRSAGFERVRILAGHMAEWRSTGRPVVKGPH